MSFESIDALQRTLADTVFNYATEGTMGRMVVTILFCSRPGGAGKNPGAHQRGPTGGESQWRPHGVQTQHRPRARARTSSKWPRRDADRPATADR